MLNPAHLEENLLQLTTKMKQEPDAEGAARAWAHALAQLIHAYVTAATPTFAPGTIQVAGAGGGATNAAPATGVLR